MPSDKTIPLLTGGAIVFGVIILVVVVVSAVMIERAARQSFVEYPPEPFFVKLTHIPGYDPNLVVTQEQIFQDAKANGWRIATREEVEAAQRKGANWCVNGYYGILPNGDLEASGYPMSTQTPPSACHAPGTSFVRLKREADPNNPHRTIPVLCSYKDYPGGYIAFGVKPDASCVTPPETILPFNAERWSSERSPLAAPQPAIPTPPSETFLVLWRHVRNWSPKPNAMPGTDDIMLDARAHGWQIASRAQATVDWRAGASWCMSGLLEVENGEIVGYGYPTDGKDTSACGTAGMKYYPIPMENGKPNPASPDIGLLNVGYLAFGVKPHPDAVNPKGSIVAFNPARWSRYDTIPAPKIPMQSPKQEPFVLKWSYIYDVVPSRVPQYVIERVLDASGWQPATVPQIQAASDAGMAFCERAVAQVVDDNFKFSVQVGSANPANSPCPGIRGVLTTVLPADSSGAVIDSTTNAGVFVYGVKPAASDDIFPFSATKWSQYS